MEWQLAEEETGQRGEAERQKRKVNTSQLAISSFCLQRSKRRGRRTPTAIPTAALTIQAARPSKETELVRYFAREKSSSQ